MQLNTLTKAHANKKSRRVGRGGRRGKTAGRGTKGQKARAGHRIRPEIRDFIRHLPKRRGYNRNRARSVNSSRIQPVSVTLRDLEQMFEAGEKVTPELLRKRGVIRTSSERPVKILGGGALSKALTIRDCVMSRGAKESIERAGGTIL